MKNLAEFKQLIERYETITLEEITETWAKEKGETANKLTGFGSICTCSLCDIRKNFFLCDDCVWGYDTGIKCSGGVNALTYGAIYFAKSPEKLLQAFRMRAKRMRERLAELGIDY